MKKSSLLQLATQILLPAFTLIAQLLTSSGYPKYGLIFNMLAQPFWVYSSWKAYKEANQIGILVTTILFIIITAGGLINYWMIK